MQPDCLSALVSVLASVLAIHQAIMAVAVIKEITSIRKFFETRDSDSDPTALQQSFAVSIIHKINLLKSLGPMDGAQINEALKDDPVGCVHTKRIKDHVEELMNKNLKEEVTSPTTAANKKGGHSDQFLKHWWNYMTESEITFLQDPDKGFNSKMTLLVERAMKVGCNGGDEQSKKWCMALLVRLHYKDLPSAQTLYDKIQDLKRAWTSEYQQLYMERIDEYPEHPRDLPKSIFAAAYADEQPHPVQLSGINAIADAIPLRKNSRLLKKQKQPLPERVNAEKAISDAMTDSHRAHVQVKSEAPSVAVKPLGAVKTEMSDDDADAAIIKAEYELKIAKLRAVKRERLESASSGLDKALPPTTAGGRVQVHRSSDGSYSLTSTPKLEVPKKEVEEHAEEGAVPQLEDLDEYTKAAIDALKIRNASKKSGAPTAPAGASKNDCIRKRPACASASSASLMKRPAAAKQKAVVTIEKEPKATPNMPTMPGDGSNPRPVHYWGGIIYTARASKKFRALRVKGNTHTESSASWGGEKPNKAAWLKCVQAITAHYKKE